ncbi:MAG: hypothetical protein ACXVRH_04285 [Thermoleophilaceae bacterium]
MRPQSTARPPPSGGSEGAWPFLHCDRCGDRIGIYERLWWRMPDGSIVSSAFLPMRSSREFGDESSRHFHDTCLVLDAV